MRILFSGGITMGPVAPLLAVSAALKKKYPDWSLFFVGTCRGLEKKIVQAEGLTFYSIPHAKLRRYWSIRNIFDIVNFAAALIASFFLLLRVRPHMLVSAGSSVSVPLHFVASLLRIPTLIHQQDVLPGLANKLMKKIATRVTVATKESAAFFDKEKTTWIGNPVRENIKASRDEAIAFFKLEKEVPTILCMGGGTGALCINRLVHKLLPQLTSVAQILHITGENAEQSGALAAAHHRYHKKTFLYDELGLAYAAADLVVCRAGFSTLTELSSLGKAAILVPIPRSHQEENAAYFAERGAALIFKQGSGSSQLLELIMSLLKDETRRHELEDAIKKILPPNATEKMVTVIEEILMVRPAGFEPATPSSAS